VNKIDVRWKIRTSDGTDFERASELRKRFSSDEGSDRRSCEPDYYRWKLFSNPFKMGFLNVSDDDGNIVGITTLTPKVILTQSGECLGSEIGDTFTHPDFQRQGMFSKLVNFTRNLAESQEIQLIYGTPNHLSLPGYNKLNFCEVSSLGVYNWILPLDYKKTVVKRFGNSMLNRIVGSVAGVILPLWSRNAIKSKSSQVCRVTEFTSEIEGMTQKASKNYDWIVKRDRRYLDWRFISNPDNYHIWVCRREGEVVGYLVTKIGKFADLRVGYLADFLVNEECKDVFAELCASAIDHFRSENVDMVSSWAIKDGYYQKNLTRFGFIRYKPVPVICDNNNWGAVLIAKPMRWHFTMADSDNI